MPGCCCERPDCDRPSAVRGLSQACYARLRLRGELDDYALPAGKSPGRPSLDLGTQVRLRADVEAALRTYYDDGITLAEMVDLKLRSALGL